MSSRRAPLLEKTGAANSPYRSAAHAATKPKRSHYATQREESYGQPPPAKRQMLEHGLRTPPRLQQQLNASAEERVFSRKSTASQPTAFERKCLTTVRERASQQQQITRGSQVQGDNSETLENWQKHQRKSFPRFVFYFESVAEEARLKFSKQVTSLGAREEKFFSNSVTHVVTTRPIPQDNGQSTPAGLHSSTTNDSTSQNSHPKTIDPSLLDRSSESTNAPSDAFGSRGKFTFEAPLNRRLGTQAQDGETRRHPARNADVLYKAQELNIKIWTVEKLSRIMNGILDADTGAQALHNHNTRSNSVITGTRARDADLNQLLRNERMNGPSDRDHSIMSKEMYVLKGPYLYIHDMDEKQKPIMVREYKRVVNKDHGEWPQFRATTGGKCPFVEEVDKDKRRVAKENEKEAMRLQKEKESAAIPRTRAAAAEATRMRPPRAVTGKRVLADLEEEGNRSVSVSTTQSNPFNPAKAAKPTELESSSRGQAFRSRGAVAGRLFAGEPVASGIQPSNITSAIRSQMISSTAAQPGLKAGTSKQIQGLQRKVLENNGGSGSHGVASSTRITDISASFREETARAVETKVPEKLSRIKEDPAEAEASGRGTVRKAKAVQQRKTEKRDLKPGYCENCQDKFDDFDEHILSKKHRRFAERLDNFKELDALLALLDRPLKLL